MPNPRDLAPDLSPNWLSVSPDSPSRPLPTDEWFISGADVFIQPDLVPVGPERVRVKLNTRSLLIGGQPPYQPKCLFTAVHESAGQLDSSCPSGVAPESDAALGPATWNWRPTMAGNYTLTGHFKSTARSRSRTKVSIGYFIPLKVSLKIKSTKVPFADPSFPSAYLVKLEAVVENLSPSSDVFFGFRFFSWTATFGRQDFPQPNNNPLTNHTDPLLLPPERTGFNVWVVAYPTVNGVQQPPLAGEAVQFKDFRPPPP